MQIFTYWQVKNAVYLLIRVYKLQNKFIDLKYLKMLSG